MVPQTARVRVAAPLRFLLAARHRHGDVAVPVDGVSTLVHVVESLGVPRTEIGEPRIGGRSTPLSARPRAGDVIDVLPVPRPQSLAGRGFVLDVHLGALTRRMRLLGIDTAYRNDATDADLVAQAAAEQRLVLTRDRGLLRRRALTAGAYVRGGSTDEQLADVLDRFRPPLTPWSRCLACNGGLEPVAKAHVQHLLQPGTRRTYTQFSRCQACDQVYWRGAHAHQLQALVAASCHGRTPPDHETPPRSGP